MEGLATPRVVVVGGGAASLTPHPMEDAVASLRLASCSLSPAALHDECGSSCS